jgi:acetyl-CoA C-acetyltransferase
MRVLASIVSAGLSKFGKLDGLYAREIFAEAAKEAFENCPNLNPKKDIEALFIGQMSESYERQGHAGPLMLNWSGLNGIPAFRVESACASSSVALRVGIMAIMSGMYNIVMVGGVEKMTHLPTSSNMEILASASDFPFEQWHGATFPSLFALMATAHMHEYGTTEEQMALVAVKNHENALFNPKAHMQKKITVQDVLSSKIVSWPLKLYDCSLISDGASCVILTKPDLAKKFTDTPINIIASTQAQDVLNIFERESLTTLNSVKLAAKEAFKISRLTPKDIDVAEVHDCFTIAEIIAYEDLGFCEKGLGGKFIEDGETKIGGKIPVNTSGGLKAKGHPVGATGIAQIYEIYLQLIGEAGKRQVNGAEIGLTCNLGGSGATATVNILKRGD